MTGCPKTTLNITGVLTGGLSVQVESAVDLALHAGNLKGRDAAGGGRKGNSESGELNHV